jgi:integrase
MKPIRVNVRFRADRGYYELWFKDHATGRRVVKSAETDSPKKAERAAALWQAELEDGKGRRGTGWDAFRLRFEQEHLAPLPKNTKSSYDAALNHFEAIVGRPLDMAYIDGSTISKLAKGLRDLKLSEERVATVLRHVKAALRFGVRIGAMQREPTIVMPKTVKRRFWRSRALSVADLEAMIAAVPAVVGEAHAPGWQTLLRGLWLTGLRINEALVLSWDSPPLRVELEGTARPRIIIFGEGQKSREDEISILAPDAADFLWSLPSRAGLVFPLTHSVWKITRVNASRVIGAIGREAKLAIGENRWATAHDLRRSFGSRWAMKVPPLVLQKMMRHKTLSTTLRHYLELDSDVANVLYGCQIGDQNSGLSTDATEKHP